MNKNNDASDIKKIGTLGKRQQKPKPIPIEPPKFKTKEEHDNFMRHTSYIMQKKKPNMPSNLVTLGQYLDEYNKIMERKSNLTAAQRIFVKNVIHFEARKGTIILTTE